MKIDTLYGTIEAPDWPDDLVIRSLGMLGEWGAAEAAIAASLVAPDSTVWDAGAFLGTFALGLARHVPPSRIVAIEANPHIRPELAHNLALLPCPSSLALAGVAARPGWLTPAHQDAKNHGATSYSFADHDPRSPDAIPCRTLSQLRAEFGDYDFLKLDLEGMELDALRGDFPYLQTLRPAIWAECNESDASLPLLGALRWLKYDVLYIAFPAFRTANHRGSADLIYPMAYEAALVAAPADRLEHLLRHAGELVAGEDILCRRVATAIDLRRALFDTPRWARPAWLHLTRAELIARLGRQERGEHLKAFLTAGAAQAAQGNGPK